jgi:hypothetical protein
MQDPNFNKIFSNRKNHAILEKLKWFFSPLKKVPITKTRMNSQITVSQQSIAKQVLVNNLRLIPDLANLVKQFAFYDKVSQVSRNLKNEIIAGMDRDFVPGVGVRLTEGTGILADADMSYVRYRHTAIQLADFHRSNLQFVNCYRCGGYIQSNTHMMSSQHVICSCGVIDLIDDEEIDDAVASVMNDEGFPPNDEDEEDQEDEEFELHYQEDDEDVYNENEYEYS